MGHNDYIIIHHVSVTCIAVVQRRCWKHLDWERNNNLPLQNKSSVTELYSLDA